MNDKDLLELAAKSVGRTIYYNYLGSQDCNRAWYPLDNDGDALCLAMQLSMSVEISEHESSTYAYAGPVPRVYSCEDWGIDKEAATRRAIVRAAAELAMVTP